MRSPAHCTPCNAFVGADAYIGPTYRTLLQPIRKGPASSTARQVFSAPGRAHGPCPTRRCVIEDGRTGSSAPTNRSVGRGALTPPPDLYRTPLQKPCHCEPVTDSLVWQSVLLVLGTGVLRIPTTSLRTGLGMTRKFFRLLSLLWQSVLRPRKCFSLHAKKGLRHPAEPLFKPIQFIRNPHCPPCAGAAPHPGCCSHP